MNYQRVKLFLFLLMLDLLFAIGYINASETFSYIGMVLDVDYDIKKYIYKLFIYIAVAFSLPINRDASSYILTALYIFIFIPCASIVLLNVEYSFFSFICLSFSFLSINILLRNVPSFKFASRKITQSKFVLYIFAFSLLAIIFSSYSYTNLFDVSNYYDIRAQYKEDSSRISVYALSWFSLVVLPVFTLITLNYKKTFFKFFFLLLVIVLEIYIFAIGGHKQKVLHLAVVIILYLLMKRKFQVIDFYKYTTAGVTVLILVSHYLNLSLLSSIFLRRLFLVPAQLYYNYVDYFSDKKLDYFAQHFPFSLFLRSNYEVELPYIIGANYINDPLVHANGNIFANAFANIGYLSYLLLVPILIIFLKLLDFLSIQYPNYIIIPVFFAMMFNFSNTSIITSFVSHGILIAIIIFSKFKLNRI